MIKKADIILILFFVAISAVFIIMPIYSGESSGEAAVYINGELTERFSLDNDGVYEITGVNTQNIIEIKDGAAKMISASCPDKLCVMQKEILLPSQSIVCLPNRVVIEVTKKKSNTDKIEVDDVTK